MGQRLAPVIVILVFQLILTPILSAADLPGLQRSVVGLAVARLEPSGLPLVFSGLPGITGGVRTSGSAASRLPGSAAEAACVIVAWLAGLTILGSWRMTSRDA